MQAIQGKSVQPGIAVGPMSFHNRCPLTPSAQSLLSPEEEERRFFLARAQAKAQLSQLWETSSYRLGEELAAIFLVQNAILEDIDFLAAVRCHLEGGATAETAVTAAGELCAAMLTATGDSLLCARAVDAQDAARRVRSALSGQSSAAPAPMPGILLTSELTPSEAVSLDASCLLGMVSRNGSDNSHTSILARAMGIPAITGVEIDPAWDGQLAVLDGDAGILYLDPDEDTLARAREIQMRLHRHRADMLSRATQPCATRDGREIRLCANVASPKEASQAWELGCQGIGLFRSEFLFLGRDTCPTEEEQFIAYQQTVLAMRGRPVIIRTLDIEADSRVPCLTQTQQENPAMGLRGIRYSLTHPQLFRQQLRAILRAAAYGPLSIMFPMVTSPEELRQAKALLDACRQELEDQGVHYGPLDIGTMIETPAAAILADQLAQEVDFFSLGTNDLTQYVLAADRRSPDMADFFDERHSALRRLMRHVVEVAHANGCWVGLCGKLGANPAMTRWLLEIGVDQFSVSPEALPAIREEIENLTLAQPAGAQA